MSVTVKRGDEGDDFDDSVEIWGAPADSSSLEGPLARSRDDSLARSRADDDELLTYVFIETARA